MARHPHFGGFFGKYFVVSAEKTLWDSQLSGGVWDSGCFFDYV